MRIDVFTIFPELVDGFCRESLLGRARDAGLLDLRCHDLRDHTTDVHRTVDDAPFGGGAGMVLRPEPVFASRRGRRSAPAAPALGARWPPVRPGHRQAPGRGRRLQPAGRSVRRRRPPRPRAPRRRRALDRRLRAGRRRGGGVRRRSRPSARLLPGVMGNECSAERESFAHQGVPDTDGSGRLGLLEEPQYTRPATFRGWDVPEVLRSGDHARIERWRRAQAIHRTLVARPDLIAARGGLTPEEQAAVGRVRPRRLSLIDPLADVGRARHESHRSHRPGQPPSRHPRLRAGRRGRGARSGQGQEPGAGPGLPRATSSPGPGRACRRPSPSARSATRWGSSGPSRCTRPSSPSSGRPEAGRRPPGQALLPARPPREGGSSIRRSAS